MSNRITAAIGRTETRIADRLASGQVTQATLDDLHKKNDMALDEYCKFQELKSLAFAQGKITLDEANTLYGFLGEMPETFNSQPLAVKVVLTQFFVELLGLRL